MLRSHKRGLREFEVVVEFESHAPTPYRYWVWVPGLDGCFSDGRTRKEALENVKEAISLYLEAQDELLEPRRRRGNVLKVQL